MTYTRGDTGGRVDHQLTVDEMPSHDHDPTLHGGPVEYDWASAAGGGLLAANGDGLGPFMNIEDTGGDQPHENRPPYMVMLYCEKD